MFGMLMSCPPPSRSPLRTFAASQARKTLLASTHNNKSNIKTFHNSGHRCSIDSSEGEPIEDKLGVVLYLRDDLDRAAQYFPPNPADGIHDTFGVFSHLVREMDSAGAYYPSSTTQNDAVKTREFVIPPFAPVANGPTKTPKCVTILRDVHSDFLPYLHDFNQVYFSHKHRFYKHSIPSSTITTNSGSDFSSRSSNWFTYSPPPPYSPNSGPTGHCLAKPTVFPAFPLEKPQTITSIYGYPNWYDTPGARNDFSFDGPPPSAEVKAEMMPVAPDELEPTSDQVRLWIYAQETDKPVTTATTATTSPAAPTLRPEVNGGYHFSLQTVKHSLGHAVGGLLKFAVEVVGKAGNQARLDAGQLPWCYEREVEEIFDDIGTPYRRRYASGISSSTEYWSGRSSTTYVTTTDHRDQNWITERVSVKVLDDMDGCVESDGGVNVDW